eukprot:Skav221060  [mRNA]  locus=scaffold3118:62102:67689:+ [translate_table: standard]
MEVLNFLHEQCARYVEWETGDDLPSWEEFFRVRSIDYRGEEVLTAQSIEWENVSPALPKEVGSVDLASVVKLGSLHYVENFEDYLVPPEDQVYVKPPKVMVPEEGWHKMCQGLLDTGVCSLIHEDDVYRVQGRLLLNGLFGVSKHEFQGPWEIRRLIMNLVPCNRICKSMDGDVSTLPSWNGMNALCLQPDENLVVSSEDIRCFFYIFRVPKAWHRFLAFNRPVPTQLCPQGKGKYYMCSAVLPMGFKNSVSLAQHVHRMIVQQSLINSRHFVGGESEIRKDRPFPSGCDLFRIYLDNFDELRKVDRKLSEAIQGQLSPMVVGLREEYLHLQVPRHPKKSVQQQLRAEVQGAIIDGRAGLAFPKPEKVLKYCHFGVKLLQQSHCTQRQAQVVGGGFVYIAMFRRPLLGALNHIWKFITRCDSHPPVVRHFIPAEMKAEVARFIALTPLAFVDFRVSPSPVVTASDASEYGGGVTRSQGLTERGVFAASCDIRGDVPEPLEVISVFAVGLFDGVGALRVAMDTLGWNVAGHVSVECNESARRVVEAQFPATLFYNDVATIDAETVKSWAGKFSQVSLVALGGGPPCQGVSALNHGRRGALRDERSSLFVHVPRIKGLLQAAFPWARVVSLMENVSSMDKEDLATMSSALELQPFLVDGKDFTLARRPRFFWFDWELLPQQGVTVTPASSPAYTDFHLVSVEVDLMERDYLEPGWSRVSPDPLPTFTTSRCRDHPGRRPAGIHQCLPHELERWENDWYRYPPYQYCDKHLLQNRQGVMRLPSAEERECILGFPRGYTVPCLPKSRQGTEEHNACRLTLLGNTWCVPAVAWILNHLGAILGLHQLFTAQDIVSRCAPGSTVNLQGYLMRPSMTAPRTQIQGNVEQETQLVRKLTTLVSLKGEDLLLQSSTEEVVRYHRLRSSIPSNLWKWSTAASWRWLGAKEHINVLEMRAVLCALRWRLEKKHGVKVKFVHLVDSQVVLHALSRGRSSSLKLRRTLLRINSLLLATGSQAHTQEERVKQRRLLGPLRQLTVQPSTRKRYDAALQKFFTFLKDHKLVLPTSLHLMDNLASDYMEHLWETGMGRALAADSLAAIQDQQPQLKGRLSGAWRLLKAWNQTELPNRAPPMPLEVLDAMVGLSLLRRQPLFGLSLLIGFHGLLRTGEILNISKKHVALPDNAASVLISLGLTKGGKRQGASESVKLTVQDVAEKTTRARIITKAEVFKLVQNGRNVVGCMYRKAGKEVKD